MMRIGVWLAALPVFAGRPAFIGQPAVVPNPNASVPLAAVLRFKPNQPVRTRIDVSDGKNSWTLNYPEEKSPAAGLPVIGMRPGRKHTNLAANRRPGFLKRWLSNR